MSEVYVSKNEDVINPGSFKEFTDRTGLVGEQAFAGYSILLDEYKVALAAAKGITLEDLHDMKF